MQEFRFYKATVQTDNGRHYIWLSASSEQSAKMMIQTAECCPAQSIVKIVEKTKKQFQTRFKH
jgi:hypothetical protein